MTLFFGLLVMSSTHSMRHHKFQTVMSHAINSMKKKTYLPSSLLRRRRHAAFHMLRGPDEEDANEILQYNFHGRRVGPDRPACPELYGQGGEEKGNAYRRHYCSADSPVYVVAHKK